MKQTFQYLCSKPILVYLLLSVLSLFAICNPLNGDVLVSLGSAIQANYLGNFPANVYHSWNLRGIGYKYFIYILYELTNLIISNSNFLAFQIIIQIIFYCIFIPLSYVSFKLMKGFFETKSINWQTVFLFFTGAILSLSSFCALQAEEVGVFLTLFLTAIMLSEKRWLHYLSGLVVCLLLSLKIVTIFFAAYPALILLFLYKTHKQHFIRYICSSIVFLISFLVICLLIFPQEIIDIRNATFFQSSLKLNVNLIIGVIYGFCIAATNIVALIPTFVAFLIISFHNFKKKYIWFYSFGLLSIPLIPVLMQDKFFPYHFLTFIPFTVIVFCLIITQKGEFNRKIQRSIVVIAFSIWLIFGITLWSIPSIQKSGYAYYFEGKSTIDKSSFKKLAEPILFSNIFFIKDLVSDRVSFITKMDEEQKLSKESEFLCLTDGVLNFFIQTKSYSRYFFPLPLQRVPSNPKLLKKQIYKETLQEMLHYTGTFIVVQSNWFKLANYPDLQQKIATEYFHAGTYGKSLYYLDVYKRK